MFPRATRLRLAALAVVLAHAGSAFAGSIWTPVETAPVVCQCAICAGLTSVVVNNEPHVGSFTLYDAWMPQAPVASSAIAYSPAESPAPAATISVYNPISVGNDSLGSFTININAGATLASNTQALAAFQRAAQQWANYISDPISIYIDANLIDMGSNTVIGSTSSVTFEAPYDAVMALLKADAGDEPDDGLVASLPELAQFNATLPTGFALDGNLTATRANIKSFDPTAFNDTAADGDITFNTRFNFDFDNSNGVTPGTVDFETVAAHEIGHLLGFVSEVDRVDALLTASSTASDISPRTLDLFRFNDDQVGQDPSNLLEFATFPRRLSPGGDHIMDFITAFADLPAELELSTGRLNGNGSQASHWRDDAITALTLGIMDPSLPNQTVILVANSDLRALDLIGYDINIPEPATGLLLLAGGAVLLTRRRKTSATS